MKKIMLFSGMVNLLLALNVQAQEINDIKPVMGVDYVYSQIDMDKWSSYIWEDKLNAYALSFGAKFNKYFGAEAFFQNSEKAKKIGRIRYTVYGLDFVGYMPIEKHFDLVGTLGVGRYEGKYGIWGYEVTEHKVGPRLGGGVQCNINDQVSFRLMGRYNYTGIEGAKNMFDVTFGFRFYADDTKR